MIKLKELFDTPMPSTEKGDFKLDNFKLVDSEGNTHEYGVKFEGAVIAFDGNDLIYDSHIIDRIESDDDFYTHEYAEYKLFEIECVEFYKYYYENGIKKRTANITPGFSPFKVFASILKIIDNKLHSRDYIIGFTYSAHKGEGNLHYGRDNPASRERLYDSFAKLINDKMDYTFIGNTETRNMKYYVFLQKDFNKKLKDAKIELDLVRIIDNF